MTCAYAWWKLPKDGDLQLSSIARNKMLLPGLNFDTIALSILHEILQNPNSKDIKVNNATIFAILKDADLTDISSSALARYTG